LSTAGYDFFPLEHVPARTWVTRSWKAYAQPLCEYILHAVLRYARDQKKIGLLGQRIGIIGYGEVGKLVAKSLHILGADVIVLRQNKILEKEVSMTTNKDHLLNVDQLILAVPLNTKSVNIIDREFLRKCKSGMHIINIARGELIDQEELLQVIRNRNIFASLDVTVPEPLPKEHPLLNEKNVTITNHIAWKSGRDINYFIADFFEIWEKIDSIELLEFGVLRKPIFEKTKEIPWL
jgi:phosphoglycerate dehydrogenase-like enzyme